MVWFVRLLLFLTLLKPWLPSYSSAALVAVAADAASFHVTAACAVVTNVVALSMVSFRWLLPQLLPFSGAAVAAAAAILVVMVLLLPLLLL